MTGWRIGYAVGEPEIITLWARRLAKRSPIQRQLLNMQLLKPWQVSRDCWKLCVRPLKSVSPDLIQFLAQVPGLRSLSLKELYLFLMSKSYGDERLYRCDSLYHSYFGRSWCGGDWHGLYAPENVRLMRLIWKHWRKRFNACSNLWRANAWGESPVLQCWQLACFTWPLLLFCSSQSRFDCFSV